MCFMLMPVETAEPDSDCSDLAPRQSAQGRHIEQDAPSLQRGRSWPALSSLASAPLATPSSACTASRHHHQQSSTTDTVVSLLDGTSGSASQVLPRGQLHPPRAQRVPPPLQPTCETFPERPVRHPLFNPPLSLNPKPPRHPVGHGTATNHARLRTAAIRRVAGAGPQRRRGTQPDQASLDRPPGTSGGRSAVLQLLLFPLVAVSLWLLLRSTTWPGSLWPPPSSGSDALRTRLATDLDRQHRRDSAWHARGHIISLAGS
jgi:hypothetical protein